MNEVSITFWWAYPGEHYSPLFAALREMGVDVRVYYFSRLPEWRQRMGWRSESDLPAGERYINAGENAAAVIMEEQNRIHILPVSLKDSFEHGLLATLIRSKARWFHWSECSRPSLRARVALFLKIQYVRRFGVGAFGIGEAARTQFVRYGLDPVRIGLLPYSISPLSSSAVPDAKILEFANGRRTFVFVGALCSRKGVDVLLKAFAALIQHDSAKDWVLILAGPDRSGGRYARLAEKLGIGSRVMWYGVVAQSNVSEVITAADVFVLPSRHDGWGAVVNEAASLGRGLISTDRTASAHHLIEHGINGYRVRAGCVNSLRLAMEFYVRQPDLTEIHGKESRRIFQAYSPAANAARLLHQLQSFCENIQCR